jgi:integrase/recombinase XerD
VNLELWQHRFEEFLQVNRYSPRTIENYRAELKPFFAFLEAHGLSQLAAVTRETLEEYRLHLFALRRSDGRALAANTQALKLTSILTFFRFLYRERFLVMDPGRTMEYPRIPPALPPKPLTEAQVVRLLESTNEDTPLGLRDRAILEVLYSSALRNSEMRELKLDELDLERGQLRVIRGKGGKHRVVPLGEPAREALEVYLRAGRPCLLKNPKETRVFLSWRGTRGLGRECLSKVVIRAAERAGLEQHVTPHLLRHCCACHMLAHRAGLRHIQELLGHSSLDTTQRYTRLELADLQKVHRRCHPRERRQ